MAFRAATMDQLGPMELPVTLPERESAIALRKIVLLALLISASAMWIAILFNQRARVPLLLSTFFADASLGLIAGFGARFVLPRRSLFIRSLVALLLAIVGMLLVGALTHSVLGVGPISLDSKVTSQIHKITFERSLFDQLRAIKIDPRTLMVFNKLDWADLIHMAVSLFMSGLALDAWSTTSMSEPIELAPIASTTFVTPAPRRRRTPSVSSNGRERLRLPGSRAKRPKSRSTPQPGFSSGNGSRSKVQSEAKKIKDPTIHPKRRRSRRKPKIQFALVEEHRCPYCLDMITHNDPRGVKECEVCHTLHHGDCWAITGMCQVPHLNT